MPGLRLDRRTGALSGTPRASGEYHFSIRVTDARKRPTTADFSLVIRQPLLLAMEAPPPEGTMGAAYIYNFAVRGAIGKYSLRFEQGGVPGLQLDQDTGKLSGVPTSPGRFTFSVRVSDASESTVSVPAEITILPRVAINPVEPLPEATVGHPIPDMTLAPSGGKGPYRWSTGPDLPPGLWLREGTLGGTPTLPGNYVFSVKVEAAGGGAAEISLRIMVRSAAVRLVNGTLHARLHQPFSQEIILTGGSVSGIAVPQPPPFLAYDSVRRTLTGVPSAIGSFDFLVKASTAPTAVTDFPMRVDVPLHVFIERPFGLEPESSLFSVISDTCLSHAPYVVVGRREDADAVLTCLQCSAANGRIPIELDATFDLPAPNRAAQPQRSLWTYSFIKAGLADDMKTTEACTGGLGLENSIKSINRSLKGGR